jgi:hypothetical protein
VVLAFAAAFRIRRPDAEINRHRAELEREVTERARAQREGTSRRALLSSDDAVGYRIEEDGGPGDLVASFVQSGESSGRFEARAGDETDPSSWGFSRTAAEPQGGGFRSVARASEGERLVTGPRRKARPHRGEPQELIQLDASSFRVADIHEKESAPSPSWRRSSGTGQGRERLWAVPRRFYPAEINQVFMNLCGTLRRRSRPRARSDRDLGWGWLRPVHFRTTDGASIAEMKYSSLVLRPGSRVSASMGLFTSQNILKRHSGGSGRACRGRSRFIVRFPTNLEHTHPIPEDRAPPAGFLREAGPVT